MVEGHSASRETVFERALITGSYLQRACLSILDEHYHRPIKFAFMSKAERRGSCSNRLRHVSADDKENLHSCFD